MYFLTLNLIKLTVLSLFTVWKSYQAKTIITYAMKQEKPNFYYKNDQNRNIIFLKVVKLMSFFTLNPIELSVLTLFTVWKSYKAKTIITYPMKQEKPNIYYKNDQNRNIFFFK